MKKRSVQVIAGMLAATAIAATTFVGTTGNGEVATTVEYTVARNEKVPGGSVTTVTKGVSTKFDSLSDVIKSLEGKRSSRGNGFGFKHIYCKGYDGDILMLTDYTYDDNNLSNTAKFYTKKSGQKVQYLGEINIGASARNFKYKDGVIYICFNRDFATILVSKDGQSLIRTDFDGNTYEDEFDVACDAKDISFDLINDL